MEEIKARLRRVRMRKMKIFEERLKNNTHVQSLSGVGVTILDDPF